jgi:hypothetical protein
MSDSFLIDEAHAEIFCGQKVITVNSDGYAAIRLSAGRHDLTFTSEKSFMVVIVPETPAK